MSVSSVPTYRFSVQEYHRLGEVGIFEEDDRVELLNGDIVVMAPIGIRHVKAVRRLINRLKTRLGERCLVDAQNPVLIDGHSELQPDLLLLRHEADLRDEAPHPEDVLLLIEVSESSLQYDQTAKHAAYARSGIGEYWVVNLVRNELLVWRDPAAGGYGVALRFGPAERVAPLAFPDAVFEVNEFLPA